MQSSQAIIAINLKLVAILRGEKSLVDGRWFLPDVDLSWNSYLSIAKGTLRAPALFVTHLRTRRKPVPDFKRCTPDFHVWADIADTMGDSLGK